MRIAFLSRHNPYDPNAFSGTARAARRALAARSDVSVGTPMTSPLRGMLARWAGPRRLRGATGLGAGGLGAGALAGYDAAIVMLSTGQIPEIRREMQGPVVLVTDATYRVLRDLYGHVPAPGAAEVERAAFLAADTVAFSSRFVRDCAVADTPEVAPERLIVQPFGANLERLPAAPPDKPAPGPLRLLFVGKDWARKGGAIAVEAVRTLRSRGHDAVLTIAGAAGPEAAGLDFVEPLGFLDKGRGGARRLRRAYAEAHLLLLPTRADCTPMVVSEANHHATPVVAADIGGLSTLIRPGTNGTLLPAGADGAAYADAIQRLASDPDAYARLSRAAFAHAARHLDWGTWAEAMITLCRRLARADTG